MVHKLLAPYYSDTRDLKEHIDSQTFVTNFFLVYMVHELIAPYYTDGDTRDLKERIDEVKPLLLIFS